MSNDKLNKIPQITSSILIHLKERSAKLCRIGLLRRGLKAGIPIGSFKDLEHKTYRKLAESKVNINFDDAMSELKKLKLEANCKEIEKIEKDFKFINKTIENFRIQMKSIVNKEFYDKWTEHTIGLTNKFTELFSAENDDQFKKAEKDAGFKSLSNSRDHKSKAEENIFHRIYSFAKNVTAPYVEKENVKLFFQNNNDFFDTQEHTNKKTCPSYSSSSTSLLTSSTTTLINSSTTTLINSSTTTLINSSTTTLINSSSTSTCTLIATTLMDSSSTCTLTATTLAISSTTCTLTNSSSANVPTASSSANVLTASSPVSTLDRFTKSIKSGKENSIPKRTNYPRKRKNSNVLTSIENKRSNEMQNEMQNKIQNKMQSEGGKPHKNENEIGKVDIDEFNYLLRKYID